MCFRVMAASVAVTMTMGINGTVAWKMAIVGVKLFAYFVKTFSLSAASAKRRVENAESETTSLRDYIVNA